MATFAVKPFFYGNYPRIASRFRSVCRGKASAQRRFTVEEISMLQCVMQTHARLLRVGCGVPVPLLFAKGILLDLCPHFLSFWMTPGVKPYFKSAQ